MKVIRDPQGNITGTVKGSHPAARRGGQYFLFFIAVVFIVGLLLSLIGH